jgi:hypothetical protein
MAERTAATQPRKPLGLTAVLLLVLPLVLLGGSLHVDTAPGQGTRIRVRLPVKVGHRSLALPRQMALPRTLRAC